MIILLAFGYLLLGAFIVTVEAKRITSKQPFNALSFFNVAYFVFFVFVPLNVLFYGDASVRQKYVYQTWSHGDMWTALVLLFCYVLFVIGYYRNSENFAIDSPNIIHQAEPSVSRTALYLVGLFSFLGILALTYHVFLMGGIAKTLHFAAQARTGELKLEGSFLFVRQFCYFLATAFMLYWAVYIDARPTRVVSRLVPNLLVGFLAVMFVFYALSTYGRREFLYPISICFAIWLFSGKTRSGIKLGWLIAASLAWVWLYSFLIPANVFAPAVVQPTIVQPTIVQPNVAQPAVTKLAVDFLQVAYFRTVQGLGDSFMHFVAAQHATLWQFGFLRDLWEIPAQFLPSKLLNFDRGRGMFGETSAFILGHPLEPGLSGEEPLGLHGYLLVNFGYPGLFLMFYLAGIGYRVLDRTLRPAIGGSALAWLVFMWATIGALEFLREGVLVLVLKPRFSWWLAIGVLLWQVQRRLNTGHHQKIQQSVHSDF